MTWSVSGKFPDDDAASLKSSALQQNPECGDQFDAVVGAVEAIIALGSVGTAGKRFHVSMSGHANPDHEPRAGWANDAVTIQISQA